MLVFGGGERREEGRALVRRIAVSLDEARRLAGPARHGALVEALIEAGCLAQSLADRAFALRGEIDDIDPPADAALALARSIAGVVMRSWDSGFADRSAEPGEVAAALAMVDASTPPDTLLVRDPEGFAHYAVFPEGYAMAARSLPPGPVVIIGLRSVGTTLAAAAAAGRPVVSDIVTLRPVGHPFRREVRVSPALARRLCAAADALFLVVDEGPGLSGSSVAAAIRCLRHLGIVPERIAILSSHAGPPGPESDDAIRALWCETERRAVTFDDLARETASPAHRLPTWFEDVVGRVISPPLDLTGGGWRAARSIPEACWPPVHPWAERRKVLLRTEGGEWLARFVGLGRIGREKAALAGRLRDAAFVPEPVALRNGFLLERWHGGARLLDPARDRVRLLARLADYLGFRARLDAGERPGASIDELFTMLSVNAAEALGPEAAGAVEAWRPRLPALGAISRPVLVDGRLHAWEWLDASGAILKADALDHHAAHDLVGPQDIAWDVAGAIVEFACDRTEAEALAGGIERAGGVRIARDLVRFAEIAYAAFQLGASTMAGGAAGAEGARVTTAIGRYRRALAGRLGLRSL